MGKGAKPDPAPLKALKGARKALPAIAETLPVAPDVPTCPFPLLKPGAAEWLRMAEILLGQGRLTSADLSLLWIYCDAYDRLVKARLELFAGGPAINTDNGGSKANPAATVVKEASGTMLRTLVAFGITPADRLRVAPPEASDGVGGALARFNTARA